MKRTIIPVGLILIFMALAAYALSLANPAIPTADVGSLGTAGTLLMVHEVEGVITVDMATGQQRTLYAPDAGHVNSAALSPDGGTLAFTHSEAPPHEETHAPTALTLLPLDAAGDARVLIGPQQGESLSDVTWSPDGQVIYFTVHSGEGSDQHAIDRIEIASGQRERLIDSAFAPTVSADGMRLVYIAVQPGHGDVLASAQIDGTGTALLLKHGSMRQMGHARLSPDGKSILLSAVDVFSSNDGPARAALLGVRVASAHGGGDASYLWQVPITGGAPEPQMSIPSIGLVADYAPDGQYIAFASEQGVFVQSLTTTEIEQLFDYADILDMRWLPAEPE